MMDRFHSTGSFLIPKRLAESMHYLFTPTPIRSCLKFPCCNVVRSRCFPLFQFSYGSLYLVLPQIRYVLVVPPFVNVRHVLFIYFAWIIVQFVEIFFPPFSHLCWFGENTTVLCFNHP